MKHLIFRILNIMLSYVGVSRQRVARAVVSSSRLGEVTLGVELWNRSRSSSAEWVNANASGALLFEDADTDVVEGSGVRLRRQAIKWLCNNECPKSPVILEFGVWQGSSLNFFADNSGEDVKLVGFDSFEGLSSDWPGSNMLAGKFSTGGEAPIVSEKVTLVKGDVRKTVQVWLDQNDLKEYCHRLLHLDLDLYEPTYSVLRTIAPYLADGDLILLDNALSYPGWKLGELKALGDSLIPNFAIALTASARHGGSDKLLVRVTV